MISSRKDLTVYVHPCNDSYMTTNEALALQILAATPVLAVREAAVIALPVSGEAFQAGRIYSKDVAFGQATRAMNESEAVATYVVYRHAAGTTIYLSKSTVLYTQKAA